MILTRLDMRAALHRFSTDTSGAALIYATLALPVLIGTAVLAVDVGRLWSLQSSLQNAADALALAGAGELDRRPDAITRASFAIDTLVSNPSAFATSVATIDGSSVTERFLTSLPANDKDEITSAYETTDPTDARFVEVTVTPVGFNTVLPVSFLGGSGVTQASATAVAGLDQAVCNFTPMFICNPFEPSTPPNTDPYRRDELDAHVASRAEKRKLIEFKKHAGGNAQWSPGNFGYLETPLGPGANALGEAIATAIPTACVIQNNISTKPGNTTVSRDAFNVRFDLYRGSYNKTTPGYVPARNVRKNYMPGNGQPSACNLDPSPDHSVSYGMPRDTCNTPEPSICNPAVNYGRVGEGDWNGEFEAYWDFNFPGISRPPDENGVLFSNTNVPSRYEIYRYEIDNGLINGNSYATPACYSGGQTIDDDPDRRIIYGAIMNCIAQPIGSGAATGLTAAAFGKFFITRPMESPQDSLWVELIDIVDPGNANAVSRDLVQLYR